MIKRLTLPGSDDGVRVTMVLCCSDAARIQRPGWEARWGSEEPARMAAASNLAGAEFEGDKETHIGSAPASADTHPAYSGEYHSCDGMTPG